MTIVNFQSLNHQLAQLQEGVQRQRTIYLDRVRDWLDEYDEPGDLNDLVQFVPTGECGQIRFLGVNEGIVLMDVGHPTGSYWELVKPPFRASEWIQKQASLLEQMDAQILDITAPLGLAVLRCAYHSWKLVNIYSRSQVENPGQQDCILLEYDDDRWSVRSLKQTWSGYQSEELVQDADLKDAVERYVVLQNPEPETTSQQQFYPTPPAVLRQLLRQPVPAGMEEFYPTPPVVAQLSQEPTPVSLPDLYTTSRETMSQLVLQWCHAQQPADAHRFVEYLALETGIVPKLVHDNLIEADPGWLRNQAVFEIAFHQELQQRYPHLVEEEPEEPEIWRKRAEVLLPIFQAALKITHSPNLQLRSGNSYLIPVSEYEALQNAVERYLSEAAAEEARTEPIER